jgi:hypothetical protein
MEFPAAGSGFGFGTVVGLPHFWQSSVIPAAAESTTNEAEQCVHAKTMSVLFSWSESVEPPAGCIEQFGKQETYRVWGEGFGRITTLTSLQFPAAAVGLMEPASHPKV